MLGFVAITKHLLDLWEKIYQHELLFEEIEKILQPVNIETDTGKLRRRHRLHEKIDEFFDVEELNDLVYRIGYNPESILSGLTKTERSLELVMFCIRHNQELRLLSELAILRPFVDWQAIVEGDQNG